MTEYSLLQIAFIQTIQITVLALIVLAVTKWFATDRPHLAHALWALVLIKCLMPPVIASPTGIFSWLSAGMVTASSSKQTMPGPQTSHDSSLRPDGFDPLVVKASLSEEDFGLEQPAENCSTQPLFALINWRIAIASCLALWILSTMGFLVFNGLRLWCFMIRVKDSTVATTPQLAQLVASVARRVGLHRKVQVRVVDAAIGPAVVGWMQATILLPKAIVHQRTVTELEPLLAHELIHIRRGDLFWATLQSLSLSLWWFNPVVWLADRSLTREAERSCDEETIASLGCNPASYARSLLDVMERKHQLRAAPSLPGVRPMDITAKRLERIMRLGHGCYRQRPWWVLAIWLLGCALALPGAAWVTAQDSPNSEAKTEQIAGDDSTALTISNPLVKETKHLAAKDGYELWAFSVDGLIDHLCKEHGLDVSDAEKVLIDRLPRGEGWRNRAPTTPMGVSFKHVDEKTSKVVELGGAEPPIKSLDGCLYVCGTSEELKQVEKRIDCFRNFRFATIETQVEIYQIHRPLTMDSRGQLVELRGGFVKSDLGLEGTLTVSPQHAVLSTGSVHKTVVAIDSKKITPIQVWLHHANNKGNVDSHCFKASTNNGQMLDIEIGTEQVQASEGSKHPAGGFKFQGQAIFKQSPSENDSQQIEYNLSFTHPELPKAESANRYIDEKSDAHATHNSLESQIPNSSLVFKSNQTLSVVYTLPAKTLLIFVQCEPVTAVPPARLNSLPKPAYVSVSDELQSDLERKVMEAAMQLHSIKDYKFEEGHLKVNTDENWKAAVNAFQELRTKRNERSADGSSKAQRAREFQDGKVHYSPVVITGPAFNGLSNRKVPMLGDVRNFRPRLKMQENSLAPPNSQEILHAFRQQQTRTGATPKQLEEDEVTIIVERIALFRDPKRFIPLLGDSIAHHVHYRCSLFDAKSGEEVGTVYVDHCHYEVVGE